MRPCDPARARVEVEPRSEQFGARSWPTVDLAGVGRYKPLLPANTIFGNGWIIVRSATCLRGDDKSDFAHEFIASVRREGEAIAAATPTGVDG